MRVQQVNLMFRAFSDRTRLRVLHLLAQQGELCVGDIVAALRIAQPMASRHLAYLRRAGLVAARREGLWKHYSLAPSASSFQESLVGCLAGCFREVPELAADLKRLSRLREKEGCCPPPLSAERIRLLRPRAASEALRQRGAPRPRASGQARRD